MSHELKQSKEFIQLFHDILHCYQLHEGNPKGVELRTEEQHKFCVKVRENLTQTISNIENIMTRLKARTDNPNGIQN